MLFAIRCSAEGVAQQMVTDDKAMIWRGVGPLNVAGNRSCTAALISDHEAVTAAHCLFNPRTLKRTEAESIRFVMGQRRDTYAALRDVTATAILPGYVYAGQTQDPASVAQDIALLELASPVSPEEALPLQVADWPLGGRKGVQVDIVGYGRDRPFMASIRAGCPAVDAINGVTLLDCQAVPGLSGAPVVLAGPGKPMLVAVVSSMVGTSRVNNDQMVVAAVAPHLAELRALIGK